MAPNWNRIKKDYVANNMSCRELAAKYGISKSLIEKRCSKERWRYSRQELMQRTDEKLKEKTAEKQADFLVKAGTVADGLLDVCMAALAEIGEDGVDTRAVKNLTDSVKSLVSTLRDVRGIPTQAEAEAQRIAAERLELDRARARAEADRDNTLVVEIGSAEEWAQ